MSNNEIENEAARESIAGLREGITVENRDQLNVAAPTSLSVEQAMQQAIQSTTQAVYRAASGNQVEAAAQGAENSVTNAIATAQNGDGKVFA